MDNTNSIAERLIDWKALKKLIPYSRSHIKRLEEAGKFPVRITLGPGRVAWSAFEIDAYIDRLKQSRPTWRQNDGGSHGL